MLGAHSLELGMIRCVDEIREQVRRETGLSLTDAQINERTILNKGCRICEQEYEWRFYVYGTDEVQKQELLGRA